MNSADAYQNWSSLYILTTAIVFSSGIACGMYATNTAETCQFIAEDSKMTIAVVEDQVQLDKFLKVLYTIDGVN